MISVLIKTFLVQAFYIPSGSMENTLLVNDRVLVNKLADKPDEIHRGDVIVFRDPGGWLGGTGESTPRQPGQRDPRRAGLRRAGPGRRRGGPHQAGHRRRRRQGRVLRRRRPHHRQRHRRSTSRTSTPATSRPARSSRSPCPKDELWVMGDHRSVSEDSRAHQQQPGKGFVPVDDVIGRAFTIVWPLDRARILHRPSTFEPARARRSRALTRSGHGTVVGSTRWGWCGSSSYGGRAASTPTSRRSSAPA